MEIANWYRGLHIELGSHGNCSPKKKPLTFADEVLGEEAQIAATETSWFFNLELEGILATIEQASGGLISFHRLDTFELITFAPINYPKLNMTDPCIDIFTGTVCAPAKGHLFWDGIHPTTSGHGLIAEEAASVLGLTE